MNRWVRERLKSFPSKLLYFLLLFHSFKIEFRPTNPWNNKFYGPNFRYAQSSWLILIHFTYRFKLLTILERVQCLLILIGTKVFGEWENIGLCVGKGADPTCGEGSQQQRRACTDGATDKCSHHETLRTVTCEDAGTPLPSCSKFAVCNCYRFAW